MPDTIATETRQELRSDLERAKRHAAERAEAARSRGKEQLDEAKAEVADRAERIADAVETTAEELGSDGDDTISEYGRSLATLVRRLAGGLRERDIDDFAQELSGFARRNPGLFLAGSVALGFGISRFLKATAHGPGNRSYDEEYEDYEYDDTLARDHADHGLDADGLAVHDAEMIDPRRPSEAPQTPGGAP
jgi:hypothetical protein